MKEIKKCIICGEPHTNKIYCSEKCQYEAYKVTKTERIIIKCLNCEKEIEILKTKLNKKNIVLENVVMNIKK